MEQTPKKIYENYTRKSIDKISAVENLISIIENSNRNKNTVESIETLKKIDVKKD